MTDEARELAAEILVDRGPSTPVSRRQGVVDAVNTDGTVDIELAASGVVIPGVAYMAHYSPVAGDVVFVEFAGSDPVVTGRLEASNGGTWTAFTPTWTGSTSNPAIGNGSLIGRYKKRGKSLELSYWIKMGSTTTFGSGDYMIGLPSGMTTAAGRQHLLAASIFDSGATYYLAAGRLDASASTMTLIVNTNALFVGATNPMAFANGDDIRIGGVIEIA